MSQMTMSRRIPISPPFWDKEDAFITAAHQMIEPYRPTFWQLLRRWIWYLEIKNFEIETKLCNVPWMAVTIVNLGVPPAEVVAVQMMLFGKLKIPIGYEKMFGLPQPTNLKR